MASSETVLQEARQILRAVTGPNVILSRTGHLRELVDCLLTLGNDVGRILPPVLQAISERLGVLCLMLEMNQVSSQTMSLNHPFLPKLVKLHRGQSLHKVLTLQQRKQQRLQPSKEQVLQQLQQDYPRLHVKYRQQIEELLILGVQIRWATSQDNMFVGCLMNGIAAVVEADVPIERAARYLSTKSLVFVGKALKARANGIQEDNERKRQALERTKAASDSLLNLSRQKSLQDLCVIAILKAVKGDTKKVQCLPKLTDSQRALFHTPFELNKEQKQ